MRVLGVILIVTALLIGAVSFLIVEAEVGPNGEPIPIEPQPMAPRIIGFSIGAAFLAVGVILMNKNRREG
jgi:hypothetical protein